MSASLREAALLDTEFRRAVSAIDAGDVSTLDRLIRANPSLVRERLESPGEWLREKVANALDGFFQRPYLLWFVAEDPVRNGRLPANIAAVARSIIDAAAEHLVRRGAPLTLATALTLGRWSDADRLLATAADEQKQFAVVVSALNGNAEALRRLIRAGADVNARSAHLYSHATPLHHAVSAGSLESVQVLVDAGADITTRDTAWSATPLGWAEYYVNQSRGGTASMPARASQHAQILEYLRSR
jgi:peptide-methionine (S)-S-oxide reductase